MRTGSNHGFFAGQYRLKPCMQRCLGKRMRCDWAGEEDYTKDNRKLDRDERETCKASSAPTDASVMATSTASSTIMTLAMRKL